MFIKNIILTSFFLAISINLKAQIELEVYKIIFHYADTVSINTPKGILSSNIHKSVETLDKAHPAGFFENAGKLLSAGKFNDASFVYYIGYFRYRYFNSANTQYKSSDDGALFGSLASVIGEPINLFLRTDVNNYINILESCNTWLTDHDYSYFSKDKNLVKYNDQITQLEKLIADITTNKERYQKVWDLQQAEYRKILIAPKQ